MVVNASGTYKDTGMNKKRKVETLVVDKREGKNTGARTFWTDGSGMKDKKKVLQTGWGMIECKKLLKKEGKEHEIEIIKREGGISRDSGQCPTM